MPWPVPAPGEISSRAAAIFEQILPGIDARSDNTGATAITRVTELATQDVYYEQGYIAQQLMPDTATDWLSRHAAIWDVPRDQPNPASGSMTVSGTPGVDLASGTLFTTASGSMQYETTAAVALGTNVTVPLEAMTAGSAGNLPAGTKLYPVSPNADLSPQSGTVTADGITGGLDLESLDSWRSRILAEIRKEPAGGSPADYVKWAKEAIPNVAYAALPGSLQQGGTVTVVVAMTGPAVPTSAELADIQTYIDAQRPVTASVQVVAATLQPVDISLQVRPDSTTVQGAAQAGIDLFFTTLPSQGGQLDIDTTLYIENLATAIENASGADYIELLAPTADVAPSGPTSLLTAGTVTFS